MSLLVLCLGNDLLGDDGVALEAAGLIEEALDEEVMVRTSAASGLYLIELLEGFEDLIVVDTYPGPRPGRVRELGVEEIKPVSVPSAHFAGLPEALEVAKRAGLRAPHRVRIFGVEIAEAQTVGSPPTAVVRRAIPMLVRMVTRAAREWGYG
jgi:hydrogenase maturation protease